MDDAPNAVRLERHRIQNEYRRRAQEITPEIYAPWNESSAFLRQGATRMARQLLYELEAFPDSNSKCLEIGFGPIGWFADLLAWAVPEPNLCGIELDVLSVRAVRRILPAAKILLGDATSLPWPNGMFDLVITSTVFTSILDPNIRQMVAGEISRTLKPGGALLWYDFAVNNPRNSHVRKVDRKELRALFPRLKGEIKSVTLAPPIARLIAPRSWVLATMLEAIPCLRTHLIAVLIKH